MSMDILRPGKRPNGNSLAAGHSSRKRSTYPTMVKACNSTLSEMYLCTIMWEVE